MPKFRAVPTSPARSIENVPTGHVGGGRATGVETFSSCFLESYEQPVLRKLFTGEFWHRFGLQQGSRSDCEAGRIRPVVDRTFPLAETAAAHRFIQERRNVGKVVLTP